MFCLLHEDFYLVLVVYTYTMPMAQRLFTYFKTVLTHFSISYFNLVLHWNYSNTLLLCTIVVIMHLLVVTLKHKYFSCM